MANFCAKCGAGLTNDAAFCPECGTRIAPAAPAQPDTEPVNPNAATVFAGNMGADPNRPQQPRQPPVPPPGPPPMAPPAAPYQPPQQPVAQAPATPKAAGDAMPMNVAALLTYLGGFITGIIFLNIEPYNHDAEVKFHAWQSIAVSVVLTAFFIVKAILFGILASVAALWSLLSIISWLVALAILALWVLLMVQAYNGKRFRLPAVTPWAEKMAAK